MTLRTLVVIPAYNEALNIRKTVGDLQKNAPGVDYIVVNDGSRDNTLQILQEN
ncbi:glycosyltransferase, partial [Faecalibaculum rodentium]